MPKLNRDTALNLMRKRDDYGVSIYPEGRNVVIAVGGRRGAVHCAPMSPAQAREIAQYLVEFADQIEAKS